MQHGVAITPVVVTTFHPVHKLQALALVIVTGSKLDGEGVLTICQFNLATLVECRGQDDAIIVGMSRQDFFLANKQLGQHDTGQGLLIVLGCFANPVDTVKSTEEDFTFVAGRQDSTHIELVALQTVVDAVVVESEGEGAVLVVTLNHNTTDTIAGGHPDASALVLGYTTDGVVAESVVFRDIVELVRFWVQYVDALARTYPY